MKALLHKGWTVFFALNAVEGLAALIILAGMAADAGSGRLLGYSPARLALMALLLAGSLAFTGLAWRQQRRPIDWARRAGLLRALWVLAPLVALACGLGLQILYSLYRTGGEFAFYAYYQRLLPVLGWAALVCLQTFVWLLAGSGVFSWRALGTRRAVYRAGLVAWGGMLLAWGFIAASGVGITRDRVGWNAPTVPLMEWQIWLAWAAGSLAAVLLLGRPQAARRPHLDRWIGLALWLTAAAVWLSQPVPPGFFATPGRAPNFEIYPFSDGAFYSHYAHSLLAGDGFKGGQIPPRPLYILFLAGLHALAGEDYTRVIALQTLALAFLPVVLYHLGRELHSRGAGLSVALLAILRELTAIVATPFTDDASNSKLFFSDLPMALVLALLTLAVVRWLKAPDNPLRALLAGGVAGLALLMRTQSVLFLPFVLLAALLVYRRRGRALAGGLALLALGVTLSIAPWVGRNYALTGSLILDSADQTRLLAKRYNAGNAPALGRQEDENDAAYAERMLQTTMEGLRADPAGIAAFVAGHFLNSEIANVLVLPLRHDLARLSELFLPDHAFWQQWNGSLSARQAALLALNLAVIALGLGAAWRRTAWVGLLPLCANLSYNLSNAVGRYSGLRYLIPADWVGYFYFALGLSEVFVAVLLVLSVPGERIDAALFAAQAPDGGAARPGWRRVALAGLLFVGIGGLLPLAERLPQRYPALDRAALAGRLLASPAFQAGGLDAAALRRFALDENSYLAYGTTLYPRYYAAGDGEPMTAKVGYAPVDRARLVFLLVGDGYPLVILYPDQPPAYFPNAGEVLVLGCDRGQYIQGIVTLVSGADEALYVDPDSREGLQNGQLRCTTP